MVRFVRTVSRVPSVWWTVREKNEGRDPKAPENLELSLNRRGHRPPEEIESLDSKCVQIPSA